MRKKGIVVEKYDQKINQNVKKDHSLFDNSIVIQELKEILINIQEKQQFFSAIAVTTSSHQLWSLQKRVQVEPLAAKTPEWL